VVVELSSVNNRFFKAMWKMPDCLLVWREEMETLLRKQIARGSLTVAITTLGSELDGSHSLDAAALARYAKQAQTVARKLKLTGWRPDLNQLLALPGAVRETPAPGRASPALWRAIKAALEEALRSLTKMREREGGHLKADMDARVRRIGQLVKEAGQAVPQVVEVYAKKLRDRIDGLLKEHGLTAEPAALAREVALFADRADVSEELSRLQAHLDALRDTLRGGDEAGRKIEFLLQEVQRETNTLGSKASDSRVSALVIEMKGEIEKIREQVQNVE
jgi:uncharacterized protein (TIGR00255 family)